MTNPAFKNPQHFTYRDYASWPENERWELIDGVAYNMTPAPSTLHQQILIRIGSQLLTALEGKLCQVFPAPFDVLLPEGDEADDQLDTVIQPDISVVCKPEKITPRGCRGAPDFIIEIASPSTARKDQTVKMELYQKHGVREYWILHPQDQVLIMRVLDATGMYGPTRVVELKSKVSVSTLPDIEIELDDIGALCAAAAPPEPTDPPGTVRI